MKLRLYVFWLLAIFLSSIAQADILSFTNYYDNDHLGSPVAATDESGKLIWGDDYNPYGWRERKESSIGYTGHVQDSSSALVYMGARHYDPLIGRFLTIDPAGLTLDNPSSFNRYSYANNNPYKFIDPDGEVGWLVIAAGAVGAMVFMEYSNTPLHPGDIYQRDPLDYVDLLPIGRSARVAREAGGDIARTVIAKKSAQERAKEVHAVLDPRAQRRRTTAATDTEEGVRVISSSERRLTPAQRAALGPNEVEGVGVGHAEVTGINAARKLGLTPTGSAASRPICPSCANTMKDQGINPLSPLKKK